ncbi:hypothetical protein ACJZ2D_015109 [Fusarium nematophilum]
MPSSLRYIMATTVDGFISQLEHSVDRLVQDPGLDFEAITAESDTAIVGQQTFSITMQQPDGVDMFQGKNIYVISCGLKQANQPYVTVISEGHLDAIAKLKQNNSGKDIWLMGGGQLAGDCLKAGLLDAVEIAVMPVLLGQGIRYLDCNPMAKHRPGSWG